MALVNPPDLRRLTDFLDGLPRCPYCNESTYPAPSFRVPTLDDTMDDQVDELIARYTREAPDQALWHIEVWHPHQWRTLGPAIAAIGDVEAGKARAAKGSWLSRKENGQ